MATERQYPRNVWVLQPSMKPKKVTVIKRYGAWSRTDYGDETAAGKLYHLEEMHDTEHAAIEAGWKRIAVIQADISKRQENLDKKKATLAEYVAKQEKP